MQNRRRRIRYDVINVRARSTTRWSRWFTKRYDTATVVIDVKGNYFFDRSPRERHGARALARFGINNKLDITLYKDEKKNGRDGKKKKTKMTKKKRRVRCICIR